MDDFREKLYSDNLHNYDYNELIQGKKVESHIKENTINPLYKKYTNTPRKSYTRFKG